MKTPIIFVILLLTASCYFPLYNQCGDPWRNDIVGTGSASMCAVGCVVCSMASALTSIGQYHNPRSLNNLLTQIGGYSNGNQFKWNSVNYLGLVYGGYIWRNDVKSTINSGKIVLCRVRNQTHWVLCYSYNGDTIYVRDSGFGQTSYPLSEIDMGVKYTNASNIPQ